MVRPTPGSPTTSNALTVCLSRRTAYPASLCRPGAATAEGEARAWGDVMKKLSLIIVLAFLMAPLAFAQDSEHPVAVGVFADYFRLNNVDQNFWGLGGRAGV